MHLPMLQHRFTPMNSNKKHNCYSTTRKLIAFMDFNNGSLDPTEQYFEKRLMKPRQENIETTGEKSFRLHNANIGQTISKTTSF